MTRNSSDIASSDDPTRDRLVLAAAVRFAAHGVERVSLEEVAGDVGLHRTTLHRHFPGGREELILAVLEHEVLAVTRALESAIAAAPDARAALVDALSLAVTEARSNRLVAVLVAESGTRQSIFGPAASELRRLAGGTWQLILERGTGAPELRAAHLPVDRVVDHVFRVVASLVAEPGPHTTIDAVRAYVADFVAPAIVG